MKQYKAIFFDWDGTAVVSRRAPVDAAVAAMTPLLDRGVRLLIVSGTTYENLAGGRLQDHFTPAQLQFLSLGLARGSRNYGFDGDGNPILIADPGVTKATELAVHDTAYAVHRRLFDLYGYRTDIIFDRPNYVKIDLITGLDRGQNLFLSGSELQQVKGALASHGWARGLSGLIALSEELGTEHGLMIKATCDAKYLEVGVLTKSDNVDALMNAVVLPAGISAADCCFWGDEFLELDEGITGSDSFMHTPLTADGDFFDVGDVPGSRPAYLHHTGGAVDTFLSFLREQAG